MKIIELKSSNIKRLKAIELTIDENQNLILITGKNAQGKSSVLDSIWYALGGKKAIQGKPIRDGEEKAEIELKLKSEKGEYIVKRSFTETGSYLSVTNTEGAKYSNPQELLDFIVGSLSFDPLEFSRMDSKKQVTELTKIVGLDFNKLDEKKKQLIEDRVLVGREQKSLGTIDNSELEKAISLKDKEEISMVELSNKINLTQTQHNVYLGAQKNIKDLKEFNKNIDQEIINLKKKKEIHLKEIEAQKLVKDTSESIEELEKTLKTAEENNDSIRKAKELYNNNKKIVAKKQEYLELTKKIVEIDETKKEKLAKAKLPIEGLSWDEGQVFYKKIPYDQLSSAEQLKISMSIAMAANPKLRMIQIRDGSLLDKDNLKVIKEMTKDQDFQAFVEKVDDTGKVGIVIEDGELKSINK